MEIFLDRYISSSDSFDNERQSEQYRKLFIGGLTPATNEDHLRKFYEQWGDLVDAVVMKDCHSGRSRGFGFVTYKDVFMVDEAQNNRPHEIDGKIVEAKRAMPREDSIHPESHMTVTKLFIGGLKKEIQSKDLLYYFQKFGTVLDSQIVCCKQTGESRGFGFIQFDDYDPVDKAILYKPHFINNIKVDVKKALTKEEITEIKRKKQNSFQLNLTNYDKKTVQSNAFGNGHRFNFNNNCYNSKNSCRMNYNHLNKLPYSNKQFRFFSNSLNGKNSLSSNNTSYSYLNKYLNDDVLDPSYYTGGYNSSGIFPKYKGCAGYYKSCHGFVSGTNFVINQNILFQNITNLNSYMYVKEIRRKNDNNDNTNNNELPNTINNNCNCSYCLNICSSLSANLNRSSLSSIVKSVEWSPSPLESYFKKSYNSDENSNYYKNSSIDVSNENDLSDDTINFDDDMYEYNDSEYQDNKNELNGDHLNFHNQTDSENEQFEIDDTPDSFFDTNQDNDSCILVGLDTGKLLDCDYDTLIDRFLTDYIDSIISDILTTG